MNASLPVVVIGAGPVGLAAAAHLLARGLEPLVLEAGASVGAGMLGWAHVRMFSPWEFTLDREAVALLDRTGWTPPDLAAFPTGGEVVARYLQPLARTPELAPRLRLGARVTGITREGRDLMKDAGRDDAPFLVRFERDGVEHELRARAVVDASGTFGRPNPIGASGLPARGERAIADRIAYGLPDVAGAQRDRYAGRRVLVVGSGHSAFNVLNDLARLADEAPGTRIHWALRRDSLRRVLGGGEADQLKERGRLGLRIAALVSSGALVVHAGTRIDRLEATAEGVVAFDGDRALPPVDEIVAATGFRPDHGLLSELRLSLDPATQSPTALAPLIDPNQHSCGSVRPHGAEELRHPDAGVYIVGMKSYGRAPTFLLLTGYEQVRSVVAAIDGDWDAARRVELVLPETGVCITQFADEPVPSGGCCGTTPAEPAPVAAPAAAAASADAPACCGGPAVAPASACCRRDEDAKAAGQSGCGCATLPPPAAAPVRAAGAATGCCA